MIFGIDFGTTYTVVSYISDGKVCFLEFENGVLLPTEVSGIVNFKRIILENATLEKLQNNDLLCSLISFFEMIYKNIQFKFNLEFVNCVLTVPVRFNDLARYFIKFAAISAQFNVVKLLQEPIAAAISVIKENKLINGNYIVYDLGGGTFDATLLKKVDDIYHVIKVDGLPNFGGIDIDLFIANLMNISIHEANTLKCVEYIPMLDDCLQKSYDIIYDLSKYEKVDGLLLTGGSAYLKNIEIKLQKQFKIFKSDNLQVSVAKGAALFGEEFLQKSQFLIDVTPFHLGIEVLGDQLEVLIEANSPIPIKKSAFFMPVNEKVYVKILQGSSLIASECTVLGELSFVSKEKFFVEFILDCDGILTVKVLDQIFVMSNVFKVS